MSKRYYEVVAVDSTLQNNGKGNPEVVVKLKVIKGPFAGAEKTWWGSLHENAAQYTMEGLRALGWKCNDITKREGLGNIVALAVEQEHEYQGKTSWRIKFINPIKSKKLEPKAPVAKDLGTRFKALAASVKVDIDPSAVAPSKEELDKLTPQAAPIVDDDPFGAPF